MTLGTNIRKFRNGKDMTQKDLADKLHVTPQAVSRWEADEVEPSIDTLKQMASLFGCSMDDLFGLEVKKEPTPIPEPEVIEKVVYTEAKPALGVCDDCKKIIKDPLDYFKVEKRHRVGRGTTTSTHILCANCNKKYEEEQQAIKDRQESERKKEIYHRRVHSFVWPTLLAIILIVIGIVSFVNGKTSDGVFFIIGAVFGYLLSATLILDNTFVSEVFESIAGLGIVRMPGVIFSLSLDGILFLIFVKVVLCIISFLIGLLFAVFAVVLCSILSLIGYPLALSRSFRYSD